MLVDDEAFQLRVLTRTLLNLGCTHVTTFDSGELALRSIAWDPPYDVIVLDVNMPGMDGIEFIRRLAECRYAGAVVLVSGENERLLDSIERLIVSHGLRARGHLVKPVRPEDLKLLLQQLGQEEAGLTAQLHGEPNVSASHVRSALSRGEIVGYFQPQVSLATDEVIGVECLARWNHPVRGLIEPEHFLPVAADAGLLPAICRNMLGIALENSARWSQQGCALQVAVNVSMEDIAELAFPDAAASLARKYGVNPDLITLEITEGQVMRQLSTALDVLTRLKLKRFRLAIDDFGTGHSSLAQLRDLPFDELKVDRSFVNGVSTDPRLQAICGASLHMARQLRLRSVAEGVELEADRDLLRYLDCTAAQGFMIARPMRPEEIVPWIAERSRQRKQALEHGQ
jgi:EAL domain-containing protein (putative c-di-GMP-specific phosphodiesterase class I)/ActR/RegA family two-component response regulator